MKETLKVFSVLLVGVFTAIIYSVLHEIGHMLAGFVLGAEVTEYNLLFNPYVVCRTEGLNEVQIIFIALSGMTLPLLITFFIKKTFFIEWYIAFELRMICFFSYLISVVEIFFILCGLQIFAGDIKIILNQRKEFCCILLIIIAFEFVITISAIAYSHPVKHIKGYFDL